MVPTQRDVRRYSDKNGRVPVTEWLNSLKDHKAHVAIIIRIHRVELGNFGDQDSVGGGVYELRIDFGPGYRVYYGMSGRQIVLLLCGGTKGSQRRDIAKAKRYWKEHSSR